MGDRYHNNHAYDHDPYYDHPAEPGRFHSSGDLSGSGSGSGGSYIDPRDRDLEAGDGYSVPDDLVRTLPGRSAPFSRFLSCHKHRSTLCPPALTASCSWQPQKRGYALTVHALLHCTHQTESCAGPFSSKQRCQHARKALSKPSGFGD